VTRKFLDYWLENYNTLERDFGMDVWEGLEHVEFWMGIVDRIVFP
jgi:hypothetical protein